MLAYIIRRLLYAIPILIGVNLLTFYLFFVVNSPDDMARINLGVKRVTPEAVEQAVLAEGFARVNQPSWSPDGSVILYSGNRGGESFSADIAAPRPALRAAVAGPAAGG